MTGFAIGLSAAALWVIVLVGVVLLIRGSSGTPKRSIRKFKGDRLAIRGAGGVAAPLRTDSRAPEAANPPKSDGGAGGVAAPLRTDSRAPEAANPPKSDGGPGRVAAPVGMELRAPEAANPPTSSVAAVPLSAAVFQTIPSHAGSPAEPPTFTALRLNSDGLVVTEEVAASEEVQEIEALVGSVTDPRAVAKSAGPAPRRTQPTVGPRKKGRITYVLVDEEGRPQL